MSDGPFRQGGAVARSRKGAREQVIGLGVIGYGRRIRTILEIVERFDAGAKVVAVVDPRADELRRAFPERLAGVTFYDDVDRMLDEAGVDGVLIGTRCSLHAPYAIKALHRRLPLFLEKPVATSWEQLAALEAAMAASRGPVVVSFPLRVSAICQTVREIVDSGAIGTIEHVQAVNNVPAYAATYYHGWMRDEAETAGLWLQKATHDFDYLNALVRQAPIEICAMESKTVFTGDMPTGLRCADCTQQDQCPESPIVLRRRGETMPADVEDWRCSFAPDTGNHDSASAIIRYASGIHAVYTQNFYTRRGAAARGATLVGYRGTITFDWYRSEIVVHEHHTPKVVHHRFEGPEVGHHGGDDELVRDFLGILAGAGESRAPLTAGILSARMCLAARDSCRTRAFQPLAGASVGAPVAG